MSKNNTAEKVKCAIVSITEDTPEILRKFHVESYLLKGKHLRAITFLSFSGRETEKNLKIAAAIELLHTATLVHDDILDAGKFRRGGRPLYLKRGISASVIYGDYLFAKGLLILSRLSESVFYREASQTLSEMLAGEITETERRRDTNLTEKDYFSIAAGKSGIFMGMSCKLGAIERGANARSIKNAYMSGIKAGITYQILDDYNDYFNESAHGNKKFTDIKNGIITLPLIYMLENATKKEREVIRGMVEYGNFKSSEMEKLCRDMILRGVPDRVLATAEKHLKEAVSYLPDWMKTITKQKFSIVHYIGEIISHERKKYSDCRSGVCRRSSPDKFFQA